MQVLVFDATELNQRVYWMLRLPAVPLPESSNRMTQQPHLPFSIFNLLCLYGKVALVSISSLAFLVLPR